MSETITVAELRELEKRLPREKIKRNYFERDLVQIPFFDVLRLNYSRYPILQGIFAVPNFANRGKVGGADAQKEGLIAGVWDICIPFSRHGFNLFFIEMKYGKNELTDAQKNYRKVFDGERTFWETHWETGTALASLEWYLTLTLTK